MWERRLLMRSCRALFFLLSPSLVTLRWYTLRVCAVLTLLFYLTIV